MGNHRSNPFARGSRTSPPSTLRDLYGRELDEGDEVIGHQMELKAPRMIIKSIRPDLRPSAQPGTLMVVLVAQVAIMTRANQPVQDLILVRTASEMAPQVAAADVGDDDKKLIES